MTISELIKCLQETKTEYGDVNISVTTQNSWYDMSNDMFDKLFEIVSSEYDGKRGLVIRCDEIY